ncbi:hypothetical protein BOTBODRAFT_238662 [Botryobasidium botryosum FD-172 SS1]|uniref:Anaphase-promoting complex subunit 4 WD40 domain-containing protein n=1 Tax=Botryobasidium botryosum (strain FD-172 SS1) TaxID=930990 RepID=A0A067MXU4_BOTB1|nr:hypothetical protein BOTBODRAFT_238662 [Botryobasidium botryosum FD-172 SS1]
MDFTELYKQTSSLVAFSPGSHFILTAVQDRIIVRRTDSFQIARTWLVNTAPSPTHALLASSKSKAGTASDGWVSHAGWSRDSEYIFAACAKRGVVAVYKMEDEEWNARIEAGPEGLVKAEWAPDGRSILCFSEWGLRVTIWSLISGTATYIQYPKHPDRGYTFRRDGRYLVLAERHKSKDTIGVYDATDLWKLVRHFPLPTNSISSLSLSPNGDHIAVWEGPFEYKLHVLNLAGHTLGSFVPDPDPGLGIRCVAWHPAGSFLAAAGWDDKIHILNSISWTEVASLDITGRIPSTATLWREPPNWLEATHGRGFLQYERVPTPHSITLIRPSITKPQSKAGIAQLEWNVTGTLLFVRSENSPTALYPITHARWNPIRSGSLVIACDTAGVYTWSDEWISEGADLAEEIAECVGIPAKNFQNKDTRWGPDGKALLLLDKETFCCAFEVDDEDDHGTEE